MKLMNLKMQLLLFLCFIITTTLCLAQQGNVTINQDQNIAQLLNLKKEMNANSSNYKIQIFDGDRSGATEAKTEFHTSFEDMTATLTFEKPANFKIWVGNYRTALEADRALKKIKRKFPNAFKFRPKKK